MSFFVSQPKQLKRAATSSLNEKRKELHLGESGSASLVPNRKRSDGMSIRTSKTGNADYM